MTKAKRIILAILVLAAWSSAAQEGYPDLVDVVGLPHPDIDRFTGQPQFAWPYMIAQGAYNNDDCDAPNITLCPSLHIYKREQGQWVLKQNLFLLYQFGGFTVQMISDSEFMTYLKSNSAPTLNTVTVFRREQGSEQWAQFGAIDGKVFTRVEKLSDGYVGMRLGVFDYFTLSSTGVFEINDTVILSEVYSEPFNALSEFRLAVNQQQSAFIAQCLSYQCQGDMTIIEYDLMSKQVVSELHIDGNEYPQKKRFTVWDNDIVVDAYSSSVPLLFNLPVYRKVDGVWGLLQEIDDRDEGRANGGALSTNNGVIVQRRNSGLGGETGDAGVIFELDENGVWQESGVARVQRRDGLVRYLNYVEIVNGHIVMLDNNGPNNDEDVIITTPNYQSFYDFDGDTLPAWWEEQYGLSSTTYNDPDDDTDQDLLTDVEEFVKQLSPINPDTDNDGMNDGFEVQFNFDPLSSSDAQQDLDGDGVSNLQESIDNTDPTNSASFLSRSLPQPPSSNSGGGGGGALHSIVILLLGACAFRRRYEHNLFGGSNLLAR